MNDLTQLLRESFEYSMTNVHTAFPGIVVKYDAETRRADIQPSIKRKLPSGEFAEFPVIPDIPVLFLGTKKYTIHFPLEKDDEVLCVVMERGTDVWRDNGGSGNEETDPRRFDLMDCVAIPGLQPVEFITAEADEGLTVVHKTAPDGDFISSVSMNDDKFNVKYKEKAELFIEDSHITVTADKSVVDMDDSKVVVKQKDNAEVLVEDKHYKAVMNNATLEIKGDKLSFKNSNGDLKSVLSDIIDHAATFAANASTHAQNAAGASTMGSPAAHTFNPASITNFTSDAGNFTSDKANFTADKTKLGNIMS